MNGHDCEQHGGIRIIRPPGDPRPRPSVSMPGSGVVLTVDALMEQLTAQPCPGWQPWGNRCLVCHYEIPEGQAAAYAHLGARACVRYCSAIVNSEERDHSRSARGRWRPFRQVERIVGGTLCRVCQGYRE